MSKQFEMLKKTWFENASNDFSLTVLFWYTITLTLNNSIKVSTTSTALMYEGGRTWFIRNNKVAHVSGNSLCAVE